MTKKTKRVSGATPLALNALADVAEYLQAGLGSDDVLSGVVGAVLRSLDLGR